MSTRTSNHAARKGVTLLLIATLSGCAVGPVYQRPDARSPTAFKEAAGWAPSQPADAAPRGAWWSVFADPTLDALTARVEVSNQNIAIAVASYAQARALVAEQRAQLFPSVTLDGGATRSGSAGGGSVSGNRFQATLGASWEPDVWGRLRAASTSASASAEASAADLATATLSAQGELATNYLSLRATDAQAALIETTVEGYQRSLQITRNRLDAGIAPRTDLLQAQTQLANAQADRAALVQQRAQLEHAIAVLVGDAPADFVLTPTVWQPTIPSVPVGMPSELLQRRPDIAGAERRMAAANAQIGIARAAYYPSFGLSGSYGSSASRVGDLFNASTMLWSLGLSVAQTVFDAGATTARVAGAQAAWDEAVARYRQTVLAAFSSVEDQLSAVRALELQFQYRQQASTAADEAERLMLNRYRAGQVSYSDVVAAQATALSARRSVVQIVANRQTAAVSLIQALGGSWQVSDLSIGRPSN